MKKVLKFKAAWCSPCKTLSSVLEDIETSIPIEEIDIEENVGLTKQFKIRGVPTMVMVDGDTELKRFVGVKNKTELQNWINN
jgi:thioredoxin 1